MHRRSRQKVLILRPPPEPLRSEGWSHRMHLETELNTCQGWEREDNISCTEGGKIELNMCQRWKRWKRSEGGETELNTCQGWES